MVCSGSEAVWRCDSYLYVPPIFAALFICCLSVITPGPRLEVDIAFQGTPLPRRLMTSAVLEATAVWAPYGVDIRVATAGEAARPGAVSLAVTLSLSRRPGTDAHALGSIPFHGDLPEPAIVLYPAAASDLVTATAAGDGDAEWPAAYREIVLGRALGRALAHEIGHFLLRSPDHSRVGLMRARQSMADLMAFERGKMFLSRPEQDRLDRLIGSRRGLSSH